MSRTTKWQVDFVSLKGKNYTVKILVENYTGDVIHLQGAPEPFTTSEDNSEDYFLPVRTQTGYLRIVDTGKDLDGNPFNWADMLPANNMQNQVQLLNGSTLVWVGYMKADLFTTQAFGYGTVVEFPLICPLSLLSSLPITFTNEGGTLLTFGQILYRALSATGVEFNHLWAAAIFPNAVDLNARVSLMNYSKEDPTITGNILANLATWREQDAWIKIINSICQFWGWTLYSRGRTLYITCSGETNEYRLISFDNLNNIIPGLELRSYTAQPISIDTLTYMSTDHYKEVLFGRRSVNIETKVNEWNNLFEPDFSKFKYNWYGGPDHVIENEADGTKSIAFYPNGTYQGTYLYKLIENYYFTLYSDLISDNIISYVVLAIDTWKNGVIKANFSLSYYIQIPRLKDYPDGGGPGPLSIQYIPSISAPNGSMISITFDVKKDLIYNASFSKEFALYMDIKIGNKYYNPESKTWGPQPTTTYTKGMKVPIGAGGDVLTNKEQFEPHNGASGFCIPVSEPLFGSVTLIFHNLFPYLDGNTYMENVFISNLKVKILCKDDMVFPTAEAERLYTQDANNTFTEDETISLDLMSGDNNKYGKGQVFDEYGDYLTKLNYIVGLHQGVMLPEEHLLKRMAYAYGRTRERLQIQIEENADNARPFNRYKRNDGKDREYSVQSVNHNFSEDTMKLTIVEL